MNMACEYLGRRMLPCINLLKSGLSLVEHAFRTAKTTRDACFIHALHIAGTHRAYHNVQAVQLSSAVGAFVTREAWRAQRVVLKLAALTRCAGHDC